MQRRSPKQPKPKKQRSKFISFCVWAIALLLLFSLVFTFYLFKTDILFDYTKYDAQALHMYQSVSVATVIEQVETAEQPTPDINSTPGPGQTPTPSGTSPSPSGTSPTPSGTSPTPGMPAPTPVPTPSGPTPPGPTLPPAGEILTVNEVEKEVYKYLRSVGYSDATTAGIMGNIKKESGMSTTIVNEYKKGKHHTSSNIDECTTTCYNTKDDAHGLCQWLGDRKRALFDLALSKNMPWYDVSLQLEYMYSEIQTTVCKPSTILKNLGSADETEYATYIFADQFERCEGSVNCTSFETRNYIVDFNVRYKNAKDYLATIQAGGFN